MPSHAFRNRGGFAGRMNRFASIASYVFRERAERREVDQRLFPFQVTQVFLQSGEIRQQLRNGVSERRRAQVERPDRFAACLLPLVT